MKGYEQDEWRGRPGFISEETWRTIGASYFEETNTWAAFSVFYDGNRDYSEVEFTTAEAALEYAENTYT